MGMVAIGFLSSWSSSLFFILLFQVVLLFSSSSSSTSSQELNTDGFFISDFLQKMGGLTQISSYDFSSPVCSWEGVSCDVKNQNVIGFVAANLGLSGSVPELTIGKLSKLESLDLSNNKITSLSSDFWSLGGHLKALNLSHNHISGSIPSNIGNFGSLQSLDLSFNNFSGEIPESISSLLNLQFLRMNQNGFSGGLPHGILKCENVVSIDISVNGISGSLPDGFGTSFLKLQRLDLSENEIHGRSSDFSGLKSLTHLNISGNFFQGSVMGVFQDPLQVTDLSRNQFRGHLSQVHFANSSFNWSNLVFLDVSENQLSGEFFHDLNNEAKNLKHLNLGYNRFSNQEFPLIQKLTSLEYLNLSKTSLRGKIPIDISQLVSLRTLDLSQNHLQGSIPRLGIKTLDVLDVSFNNLTGEIPSSLLAELPQMEKFNFSFNNLSYCNSQLLHTRKTAFQGLLYSCPIAVKPDNIRNKTTKHRGMKLTLAVTLAIVCFTVGLICLVIGCTRKTRMWAVKQISYKEEASISGPFSFQTDSTTWVADVKQATAVPVVIFEKPLLNFTFVDLLTATSHFDRGILLAEGRFGPVYRGFLPGGIQVAVKVLVLGSTMTDQEAARELESLGRIKHPNLVPLSGYCLAGDQRIALYDYMENGNLQNLLHDLPLGVQTTEDWSTDTWEEDNNAGIQSIGIEGILTSWRFRHKIALGTARALSFLHHGCSPPIIHRDVKASSVYLDSDLEPRLSDFGLAKIFGNAAEENISRGSPGYIPPEFSESENSAPTPKSDVYGFGVVLLELITGKKPAGDDYAEQPNLVSWVRGLVRKNQGLRVIDPKIRETGQEKQMEEAVRIGYLCTADLPTKRPSMQQIVGLLKDIEPVVHQ